MLNTRYNPLRGASAVAEPPVTTNPQPAQTSAPATVMPQSSAGVLPAPGLKKVSLGAIAKKEKDTTANKYPVYPDETGAASELAARIADRQEQFDALKSALETDKAELSRVLIRPWYLQHFHRKTDVPSSVLVNWKAPANPLAGPDQEVRTGAVRVTVKEQYYSFDGEDSFVPILGDQVAKYFRQAFELKIDGDKLPSDKAGELGEKLQTLFAEYGCLDALEAKETVVPVNNFKALRFTEMDLTQSLALETVGDKGLTECAVSTKVARK